MAAKTKEKEKAEVVVKKTASKKETPKKKEPMSNEEIVLALQKDLKADEKAIVEVGGCKFTIKEVRGTDIVLTRKDYR